jgi:hypothetical protein
MSSRTTCWFWHASNWPRANATKKAVKLAPDRNRASLCRTFGINRGCYETQQFRNPADLAFVLPPEWPRLTKTGVSGWTPIINPINSISCQCQQHGNAKQTDQQKLVQQHTRILAKTPHVFYFFKFMRHPRRSRRSHGQVFITFLLHPGLLKKHFQAGFPTYFICIFYKISQSKASNLINFPSKKGRMLLVCSTPKTKLGKKNSPLKKKDIPIQDTTLLFHAMIGSICRCE